jgi:hypothetical protein
MFHVKQGENVTEYNADEWRRTLAELSGSDWDEDEWEGDDRALALIAAYHGENGYDDEDMVEAAVEACAKLWTAWTPEQLTEMMGNFSVMFKDMTAARQQYLDETYPGTEVEWYKDDAPVWNGVFNEGEIVVEDVSGRIYLFDKPDRRTMNVVSRGTSSGVAAAMEHINLVIAWYNREIYEAGQSPSPDHALIERLYAERALCTAQRKALDTATSEEIDRVAHFYANRFKQLTETKP